MKIVFDKILGVLREMDSNGDSSDPSPDPTPTPSSGLTASGGSMDFTDLNGSWTEAGTTTVSGTTASYFSKTVSNKTYYVTRAYSSFEGSIVWAITDYNLESEADDWSPNLGEACMAYVSSSAASPVGLSFSPTYQYDGNAPSFSAS